MPSKLSNLFLGLGCLSPIVGIGLLLYFLFQSSIFLGFLSVIISLLAMTILFVLTSQIEEKRKIKQAEFLQTFQPNQYNAHKFKAFTSYDLLAKIAIDEQRRKVYFWFPDSAKGENSTQAYVGMPYIIKAYSYSDILAIKLLEDNHQTATVQKDTHSLLNRLSEGEIESSKASLPPIDKISSMDLEIIVNDNVKPRHLIRFYHMPHARIRKDSPQYQAYLRECQQWFTILEAIIHESEQNVAVQEIEYPMETTEQEPSIIEESLQEAPSKETTHITIDVDTERYSLRLHEESKNAEADHSQQVTDEDVADPPVKKPLSYFEQLIEKNRRQMRGDFPED